MQRTNARFANQDWKLQLKKYIAQQGGGFVGYVELSAVFRLTKPFSATVNFLSDPGPIIVYPRQ